MILLTLAAENPDPLPRQTLFSVSQAGASSCKTPVVDLPRERQAADRCVVIGNRLVACIPVRVLVASA